MKQPETNNEAFIQQAYESIVLMACEALKSSSHLEAQNFAVQLETYVNQACITSEKPIAECLFQLQGNDSSGMTHLADAIMTLAPYLVWHDALVESSSNEYDGRHSHTELIGPDGHSYSNSIRFGFFLQYPYAHYPAHAHEATEIYLLVSGEASWRVAKREWRNESRGCLIKHEPMETHQMKTDAKPLLAIWGWYGDISVDSYHFTND